MFHECRMQIYPVHTKCSGNVHNLEPSSDVYLLAVRCLTVAGTGGTSGCLIKWE